MGKTKVLFFWFATEATALILYLLSLIYIPAVQEESVPSILELFQKRIQILSFSVYDYV